MSLLIYSGRELDETDRERLRSQHTAYYLKGRIAPEACEPRVLTILQQWLGDMPGVDPA